MATAGDVIDAALYRLDQSLTVSAAQFWTRTELLILVNDGFLEFTLIAGQMVSENNVALAAGNIQDVPSTAIAVIHVSYASEYVEKSSLELFDRGDPDWESKYGILRKWAPMGLNHWIADRYPISSVTVALTTLDKPPVLIESDDIDLAEEYVSALIDYVFHMARFKEGGGEFAQSMDAYDEFRSTAGLQEQQTYAEQWLLWSRDPNADTGPDYSTLERV